MKLVLNEARVASIVLVLFLLLQVVNYLVLPSFEQSQEQILTNPNAPQLFQGWMRAVHSIPAKVIGASLWLLGVYWYLLHRRQMDERTRLWLFAVFLTGFLAFVRMIIVGLWPA